MYVKDLGRCFEKKTGYPLRMTANNDKRGSSSEERNFFIILCDEREDRKNIYKAGKAKFSFHMTHS